MKYLSLNLPGFNEINAPNGIPTGGFDTVQKVVQVSLTLLFIVAIVLALVFLIWGGIQWTTSGGSKEGIQKARQKLTFAIIGLVVVLLAIFIVSFAGGLLKINPFGK